MIPYGRQDIQQQDIDAVVEVLQSDFLTQGPQVPLFEKSLVDYTGAKFGCAVNSATSALHLACLSLGLGRGDYLWTSPNSFVASANVGLYCGAIVDFVDIDPETYNMSVEKLDAKLIEAEQNGVLPKIVIPVHFSGQACDMKAIHQLSQRYGFRVIEDASHAVGGRYQNDIIGNCRYSDITVFSFHPVKIITTAEGGLALTNNPDLAEKMALLRSHGITRDEHLMQGSSDGPWYYQQVSLGYNYRMTDMQAALGVSQLQRLDDFVAIRHQLVERYNDLLSDLPITLPAQSGDSYSAWHLYVIQVQLDSVSRSHREVFEYLREHGVGVNLHYIPIHLQPYYQSMGHSKGDYPNAEKYYSRAISIPLYPNLSDDQQGRVAAVIREALA
ncbi:MAG: UDP-4-amino-4,6-dideoxy-N-acetyl-beta-L-altrosamine transaminase [Gammaproteobacteria bacterium]|nr:UDP-4-amino-4,6-dideoxy-N-acetyl-beta-L-altrosamine transaminase [Gammaproteobacteria bacterium]